MKLLSEYNESFHTMLITKPCVKMSRLDCGVYGTVYTILKRSCDFLLCTKKQTNCVLFLR